MEEKQLTFKEDEISQMLNHAFDLFREGRFPEAASQLEKVLRIDFDYPDVTASLKCANFWRERQERLATIGEPYERGELLLGEWRHFVDFVQRIGGVSEKGLFSVRQYVFGTALAAYRGLAEQGGYDADLLLRIGRCYKELGSYDLAIESLEKANQMKNGVPSVLAELADCYALVGETRSGKIFFREAFFLGANEIDLSTLESGMIQRLVQRLRGMNLSEAEVREWVPVYGAVYGVLNVKRELRPLEYGKLKQSIFRMENQLETDRQERDLLVPRLLNHYFWLIDHYAGTGEERSHVEEVLARVKRLDPAIYREYTR